MKIQLFHAHFINSNFSKVYKSFFTSTSVLLICFQLILFNNITIGYEPKHLPKEVRKKYQLLENLFLLDFPLEIKSLNSQLTYLLLRTFTTTLW